MEFVAIDFETTGYEDGNVNEPWQLGAALVRDLRVVETREWFFATSRPFVPPGRGPDMPGQPGDRTILDTFPDWSPFLAGRRLVVHNLATEKTILTRVAPLTKWGPWTDTLRFAKARYPKLPGYTLGELCAAFGCVPQLPGRSWHDGLYDAVACAGLAIRMAAL